MLRNSKYTCGFLEIARKLHEISRNVLFFRPHAVYIGGLLSKTAGRWLTPKNAGLLCNAKIKRFLKSHAKRESFLKSRGNCCPLHVFPATERAEHESPICEQWQKNNKNPYLSYNASAQQVITKPPETMQPNQPRPVLV